MDLSLLIIIVLVLFVAGLIIYNLSIGFKIKKYKSINDKINNLNVLQDFLNAIGEDTSVNDKIEKINNTIIEKFNIKYSTIVVFNGAEYIIKATNVSERHWETMKNLHTDEMFKDSIETTTPKYVTI